MNWETDFADLPPIDLPDDRTLGTLADLRAYILALPEHERGRSSIDEFDVTEAIGVL